MSKRKNLPQMSLDELETCRWFCKYQWCDVCYDCLTCPAWQPTDCGQEDKDFQQLYYKILPFAGIGRQEDIF